MKGTWKDDRTLDEMATTDAEMLERCYKKSDHYDFKTVYQCQRFIAECLRATLKKFGIEISGAANPAAVDAAMRTHGVKVEHRLDYHGDDQWKKGLYIYKDSELVAFISHPLKERKQTLVSLPGRILNPGHTPFRVYTNCKVITSRLVF